MSLNSIRNINTGIVSSCVLGLALSSYAYIVETSKEIDPSYEAMCDISEHVSCTKAFMSAYGKGFGLIPEGSFLHLPNSVYGFAFYIIFAVLSVFNTHTVTFILVLLAVISNLTSIYLAFILYVLKDFCIVCMSTYLVNAANLLLALRKLAVLSKSNCGAPKKRKTK